MIRRNITLADGTRYWSLISQVDHARISGELAAAWGNEHAAPVICPPDCDSPGPLLAVREEVVAAIAHHDDGWRDWEAAPTLDPEHHRPRSFMEMPLVESLDIWRKSILACERIGPLAAWMVAGHFIELRCGSESQSEAATAWVDDMFARRERWLAEWQALSPEFHTKRLAGQALGWLRSFDVLSLWLCCGERDPLPFPPLADAGLPIEQTITFKIAGGEANNQLAKVTAQPWPLRIDRLELSVDGLLVPAGEYQSAAECLAAVAPTKHEWHIVPTVESSDDNL